jgi:hypothetical protein
MYLRQVINSFHHQSVAFPLEKSLVKLSAFTFFHIGSIIVTIMDIRIKKGLYDITGKTYALSLRGLYKCY